MNIGALLLHAPPRFTLLALRSFSALSAHFLSSSLRLLFSRFSALAASHQKRRQQRHQQTALDSAGRHAGGCCRARQKRRRRWREHGEKWAASAKGAHGCAVARLSTARGGAGVSSCINGVDAGARDSYANGCRWIPSAGCAGAVT